MLYINSVKMASPSALNVSIEDRGDFSAVNVLGQRLADRLATKRTVDAEWSLITAAEAAQLMQAVTDGVFFKAKFPDPGTGGMREGTFRAAERSARVHRMDGAVAVWADVRMRWEDQ